MDKEPQKRVELFVPLLLAHHQRLYQYLHMAMPRSQEIDIDDVLQETSLVMWQKFDESCPAGGFYTWACRIAHLKVLEWFARKARDVPILDRETLEQITLDETAEGESLTDIKPLLQLCMDKLPPRDRELIERRYEPGVRVEGIAIELGRPVNSVSKSLGRIRQTLWRCIDSALKSQISAAKHGGNDGHNA